MFEFPALAAYEKKDTITQVFPKILLPLYLLIINAQPKIYWFYIGNIARHERVKEFSNQFNAKNIHTFICRNKNVVKLVAALVHTYKDKKQINKKSSKTDSSL